jgi:DNA (cytosine-5)-methyltransferase 1
MNCIDLYSGIGGWTLGMKLSGIDHVQSFEWNFDSNLTHNRNFGTDTEEIDIRNLDFNNLPKVGSIDFVVGSPPCTQFSFANRGGGGDIQDGLIDIYQFLCIVEYLQPKYWAMENIPRVKLILEKVLEEDLKFKRFNKLINYIKVIDSSEFGVPQKRKRMIAGNFPFQLFEAYKTKTHIKTLGNILSSLNMDEVVDPIYGYTLPKKEITDNIVEESLNQEELKLNQDSKSYHPVYNTMAFPEKLDKPSRTITSTCTRVSRESLIIRNGSGYRRLTVRERGMLMGFPITYQFYGKTFNSKLKMIGNAIPPILTYYLFQSMLNVSAEKLTLIGDVKDYFHESPKEPIPITPPDTIKFKYRDNRSFRLAVPGFRFGSGVRFELSNTCTKTTCNWRMKFFYGSSKKIKEVQFPESRYNKILEILAEQEIEPSQELNNLAVYVSALSSKSLQKKWTHKSKDEIHPYKVLYALSMYGLKVKAKIDSVKLTDAKFISTIGDNLNQKLFDNKSRILSGVLIGHVFNKNLRK